jgi:hypothetical protein
MLAVTAAAGGKSGVCILREGERRRRDGKREGSKQQDGQQASHADGFSERPQKFLEAHKEVLVLLGCVQNGPCCGLS